MARLLKSSYRRQERPGWCGPAALQVLLLNESINISQSEIAKNTFFPDWGTPHENIYSFAKKYFAGVNVYTNTTLKRLEQKLNNDKLVLANIVTDSEDVESGHYINIQSINLANQTMTVFDPDAVDGGILNLNTDKFVSQWFDYATEHDLRNNIKTKHWALVIDPKTKKSPLP